ncbi:MAG: type VI secretion system ATPase TssH, partial [Zavarzinella sp.]|nr:type VI secretion system ATPase TssH [Zavarzinella sp.]
MDINRFTEKAREALQNAQKLAVRMSHQQIDDEHLLLALLDQEGGLTPAVLKKAGVAPEALTIRVQRELEKLPRVSTPSGAPDNFYLTGRLNKLL